MTRHDVLKSERCQTRTVHHKERRGALRPWTMKMPLSEEQMRDRVVRWVKSYMRGKGIDSDYALAKALDAPKSQISTLMSKGQCGIVLFYKLHTLTSLTAGQMFDTEPPSDIVGFLPGKVADVRSAVENTFQQSKRKKIAR